MLAGVDGRPTDGLVTRIRQALEDAPDAERWARSFTRDIRVNLEGFRRHAAPNTVRHAVTGIAHACVPDPDSILRDLLAGAIVDCEAAAERWSDPEPAPDGPTWADLCELTGVVTPSSSGR
jgi:hypothetical protein